MAKAFWDTEKTLADVDKPGTKSTFYRFKEVTKNGKRYIDFREHYKTAAGEERFTGKGTAIPVDGFADVMVAFRDVADYIKTGEMPTLPDEEEVF